jgi:HK97 family phage major capsid protein
MPVKVAHNADEIKEVLTDRASLKELLNDNDKFVEWVEKSINARIKSDPAMLDQLKESAELAAIKFLRDQGMDEGEKKDLSYAKRLNLDAPYIRNRNIRTDSIYNKAAIGAKFDKMFNSTPQFLHAISEHSAKDAALSANLVELKNAMSSMKPSDGGFLIPEILRADLLRIALERAIVRSRARVIPMDSLTVPLPAVDSTSNVASVYGGVVGYWTEEGATITESRPRFARVELRAQKLTLYTEMPNELIRDSIISLEAFIGQIFPEALAWFEDVAFFIGGGVGEPLGFLNAPAAVSVTRDAGQGAVEWIDVVNMYCRMLPQSIDRAVWVVSPDVMASLLTMTFDTGAGTGTAPVMLGSGYGDGGTGSPSMTMLGRPIVVSEKARAAGTSGDINFVDFGFYLIGDRQAMSARQSEDFRFNQDVTAFRVIERVDGRPWVLSPVTPQNGGSTLSPFVKLT